MCQKFYGVLSLFEVVLRNAVNEHYKRHFGDNCWIRTQIQPRGMLDNCPQLPDITRHLTRLINNGIYTHDRLVSSVSFGFWTYLFNKQPFRKGGQSLLAILPNRTKGLGQRAIYKDVNFAQYNYNQILKYVYFLGYNKNELFFGLDVLPDTIIAKINHL